MEMIFKTEFDNLKNRIMLAPITAILYFIIIIFVENSYYKELISGKMPFQECALFLVEGIVASIIFIELSVCYSRLIFRGTECLNNVLLRMLFCFLFLFIVNNFTAYLVSLLFIYMDNDEIPYFYQNLYVFGMLISFISEIYIASLYVDAYISTSKKKENLEIKLIKEKQIATKAQLTTLKSQLNPHFLYNNFNILSELIHENQDTACQFVEHLSKVYRNILKNLNNDTTSISEELNLFHSYIFLLKIRYGEALHIKLSPMLHRIEGNIIPASLQLLVENAIKHNQLSVEYPLIISIYQEESFIVVENPLCPLLSNLKSAGIGLKNMEERYLLLSDKTISVLTTSDRFIVKLPILPLE